MSKPPTKWSFPRRASFGVLERFIGQEINVFGPRQSDEHDNCLGGGFLISIEDGFLLLAERPNEPPDLAVTLTEAAARHVQRYLAKRGKGVGVRLGVKTTGCSGLAYKLEYVDEVAPEDELFEQHGVKLMIDPKSLAYIDGTELDYVREGLNEGFRFNNPNERDRCGCGESFRV